MKTISRETALLMTIYNDALWDNHRVEYTPLKRDPQPEDRILWIDDPQKNILEILTKMDDKDYDITESDGCYTVYINLSMFPKFEELKIVDAAIKDELISPDTTSWDRTILGEKASGEEQR